MKYILTIDDDEALCKLVKKCIETEQVPVYTFLRGEDALSFFYQNQSDCVLVILDIMLPGMDGYSVLEKVRAVSNVPVLMLTAKDQEEDKVAGLQNGADDYLTKPFGLAELTARVNSLVRRRFHDMIIDPSAHSVEVQGKPVSLTAREFDILLFLAQHKGRIFTKQQIYQNIWKEPYYQDDGNIMSIISKLRKKIEPDPEHPFYVLTVYGVGYRFNEKA